jgi:hypothetical protein
MTSLYFQQSNALSNSSLICCYGRTTPQSIVLTVHLNRASIKVFGCELNCIRASHDASSIPNQWTNVDKASTWQTLSDQCRKSNADDFEMTCYLHPTPIADRKFLDTRIRQYIGSGCARRRIVTIYAHFVVPNSEYFDRILAITMASHRSLGAESQLGKLGSDLLRSIAEAAVQPWSGATVPRALSDGRTADIPRWMLRISVLSCDPKEASRSLHAVPRPNTRDDRK